MSAKDVSGQPDNAIVFHVIADERLDYKSINCFKNLCPTRLEQPACVVIDMSNTRYADSSGLALLHCLQHWIKAPEVYVRLENCPDDIRRVLMLDRLAKHIEFSE